MKKVYLLLASLVFVISGILLFNFIGGNSNAASLPRDCNDNAIVKCGATSASELATVYKKNASGDLRDIYHSYGLTDNEIEHAGSEAKMGAVHKDGRVTVGNATVATDAMSIGRQNISGSHKKVIAGRTYYERPPSVSFRADSIAAYVFFDGNGNFKAAVITSCGNPVTAKKPVYTCDSLKQNKISRTEYGFEATASASNGANISSYSFDFGDGHTSITNAKSVNHTYSVPGIYTVKLTVHVKVNGTDKTVTSTHCETQVIVETPPPAPVYACDSLSANKINRTDFSFNGAASATGGAVITNYTFDFGDTVTKTVTNPSNVMHTYEKEGTYAVVLSVTFMVNGQSKTVTNQHCQTQVTVETPPVTPIYTCDGLIATKINRTDFSFNGIASATGGPIIKSYTFDFGDASTQTVTNPVGVTHTYGKEGAYTVKLSVLMTVNGIDKVVTDDAKCIAQVTIVPVNECKPGVPMGDTRCSEECKPGIPSGDARCTPCEVPGKEQFAKNSPECVTTPVELPHTGPMDVVGGGLGIGSLIAAASYWYMSRRGLLAELRNR